MYCFFIFVLSPRRSIPERTIECRATKRFTVFFFCLFFLSWTSSGSIFVFISFFFLVRAGGLRPETVFRLRRSIRTDRRRLIKKKKSARRRAISIVIARNGSTIDLPKLGNNSVQRYWGSFTRYLQSFYSNCASETFRVSSFTFPLHLFFSNENAHWTDSILISDLWYRSRQSIEGFVHGKINLWKEMKLNTYFNLKTRCHRYVIKY